VWSGPFVLESAGIADARAVLILSNDDLVNISATLRVRAINPHVRIVLRLFNQSLLTRLGSVLRNVHVLSTSLLTAPVLAMTAVAGQRLAAFEVDGGEEERRIVELQVGPGSQILGRSIGEVLASREAVALAHLPAAGPERSLLDVDAETRLRAGDHLVLCARPRALAALESDMDADAPHLLWAASRAVEQLPLCVAEHLTRGQAEDLLALLLRERVEAKLLGRADL
jgi:Trk K+ transport system NAD-binding subunit